MLDLWPLLGLAFEFGITIAIVGIIIIIGKIQNWKVVNKAKKKYYKSPHSLCLPKPTNKSAIK